MELLTEFSKLRLESAKICFDGSLHIRFLEYIPTKEGGIHGLRQIDIDIAHRDEAAFESELMVAYLEPARMLWNLRDGLVAAYEANN